MNRIIRRGLAGAKLFGVDLRTTTASVRSLPIYLKNRSEFRKQAKAAGDNAFPEGQLFPCLADRHMPGGTATGHYFHMDLHCAKLIASRTAQRHIDVGSRVDGFVAHVASFRTIEVLDIRPIKAKAANITFHQHDLMAGPGQFKQACDSLSCLHALEHLGLGRYGDTVDYNGHLKGWNALYDMLKPNGRLYFAVPMGNQRIEYDAHRVFSMQYLLETMINPKYDLESFAYVDDNGELQTNADTNTKDARANFGCRWGCAIFDLLKVR